MNIKSNNEHKLKRKTLSVILIFLGAMSSCQFDDIADIKTKNKVDDTKVSDQVIYGEDGRRDLYQVTEEKYRRGADATVSLMAAEKLLPNGAGWEVSGPPFREVYNLCPSEPYGNQQAIAFCSGSLVSSDLILTAGHCISTATDCRNVRFVFGFAATAENSVRQAFTDNDVYECGEVVHSEVNGNGADFAVVRLTRPVVGHQPITWRRNGIPTTGERVYVIGHPVGLPLKVTLGGKIRSVQSQHLVTNLDTYGGNSGSPVFSEITGDLEGVLVRGENDFITERGCRVSQRCTDDACRGEDVTRIDQVVRYLPNVNPPNPPTPARFEAGVKPNLAIPDNTSKGVVAVIAANQAPKGRKVRVTVNIKHTYRGDLVVDVSSPDGKTVTLHNKTGGSADDLVNSYDVNSLNAVTAVGEWKLTVKDLARIDVGQLLEWKLVFE